MLDPRKNELFFSIVKEHIATCAPVGSKAVVAHARFGLSSATIRNEMADLEQSGLIEQPHTSAGRIPTEKGWKYYIENLMQEQLPDKREREQIQKAIAGSTEGFNHTLKAIARTLATMSKNAAFVGFSRDDVYYTGLSNLFSNPEFAELDMIRNISEIVDHLDDVMHDLFADLPVGRKILIGGENPFGKECGVVIEKIKHDGKESVMGVLGPIRMAYDKTSGIMTCTKELLTS